jgi:PAS domain S-box-containing protein
VSEPGTAPFESADSALLETLVREAPVAFVLYDTDLRYRRINRMLAEINGLPMQDHIGKRPTDVLPRELGEYIEGQLRDVLRTGRTLIYEDDVAPAPRTGEMRHYRSQWFPASGRDGEVVGVAVLISDVTDRRRDEERLRELQDRTATLQRATAALSRTLTVDDVRRVMRGIGWHDLGAIRTEVLDVTGGGPEPTEGEAQRDTVLPLDGSAGQIGRLWLRWAPEGDDASLEADSLPEAQVVGHLALAPGVVPAPRDLRRANPRDLHLAAAPHVGAAGTGSSPGRVDEDLVVALAAQCAIALERCRLYERERSTAAELQRSLLPDRLPEAPGVELAARFRPGSVEADVGGDWYDAFTLPDGRLVLVIGDVMGKGVVAAAGMGRLRSAVRALALVNPLPEAVLNGLDRVFSTTEDADQIATLVYLLVNPVARRAAIGGAGHLPLVLQRRGSAPELIDAGSGATPLGWPEPRSQRTLELGRGDLLLGITDGVVERRGFDLDEGLATVVSVVAASSGDLESLVERVSLSMLGGTEGRDDATVLALRFT